MGSVDSMVAMQNLRGSIHGIPISGMLAAGFPHSFSSAVQAGGAGTSAENAKNGLNMLPMILQSIPHPHGAAVPQHTMFSIGTMMAQGPPPSSTVPSSSSSSLLSVAKVTTTTTPSTSEAASPSSTTTAEGESAVSSGCGGGEKERSQDESGVEEASIRPGGVEASSIINSASRARLVSNPGAGGGSHITFNPFLIPGMSHGLLYPHIFLPHGGIMALPAMPQDSVDGLASSPKRRRKRGREEGGREEEGKKAATGQAEEEESTVKISVTSNSASASSPSVTATSTPVLGLSLTEEHQNGQGDREDGPAEIQEADSNELVELPATGEAEERLGDVRGVAVEEGNYNSEEQRQMEGEEA